MNISDFQKFYNLNKIVWSTHGLARMQERDISIEDVGNCILHGEIIEEYVEEPPAKSSALLFYKNNDRVIHVVLGIDDEQIYFVTAYIPNTDKFEEDLKTRRK